MSHDHRKTKCGNGFCPEPLPDFDPGYGDELVSKNDVLRVLHGVGGTGAEPGTYDAGWDEAIDNAFRRVEEMPPEVPEDYTAKDYPDALRMKHVLRRLVYAIKQHVWEDMTKAFMKEVQYAENALKGDAK